MKFVKSFESYNNDNEILTDISSRISDFKPSEEDFIFDIENYLEDEKGITVSDGLIHFNNLEEDQEYLIGDNYVVLYHFTSESF